MKQRRIQDLNLRVIVMDTDYYALQKIGGLLGWDRRTRVERLFSSPLDMWEYLHTTIPVELPEVVMLEANHLGGATQLLEHLRALQALKSDMVTICLSQTKDADLAEAAANGNAKAFFQKGEVKAQIAWATIFALDHDFTVTHDIAAICAERFHHRLHHAAILPPMRNFPEITLRVRQALDLCVVDGMPAALAAHEMAISLHTIRSYVKEGYRILESYDDTDYPNDMTPQERAFMRLTSFADDTLAGD